MYSVAASPLPLHFLLFPIPVGKREIEEEVNQARALTYSTKKENCAVVNRPAWLSLPWPLQAAGRDRRGVTSRLVFFIMFLRAD